MLQYLACKNKNSTKGPQISHQFSYCLAFHSFINPFVRYSSTKILKHGNQSDSHIYYHIYIYTTGNIHANITRKNIICSSPGPKIHNEEPAPHVADSNANTARCLTPVERRASDLKRMAFTAASVSDDATRNCVSAVPLAARALARTCWDRRTFLLAVSIKTTIRDCCICPTVQDSILSRRHRIINNWWSRVFNCSVRHRGWMSSGNYRPGASRFWSKELVWPNNLFFLINTISISLTAVLISDYGNKEWLNKYILDHCIYMQCSVTPYC